MKIAVILLMSLLALSVFGQSSKNGVYVQKGKTTEIDLKVPHAYYSVKPTNSADTLYFSNGLSSKVETNSELIVNSFVQDVLNTSINPEKAKFGDSILNVSLMSGTAYFSYTEENTNSQCVVSTPFADVELHKGSYYFVVNEHNALVIVIDGSIVAYGDKKDEIKVSEGHALVAIPNTQGILDSKISLSTQFVREPVMARYKSIIKEISGFKDNILFIIIGGKTTGVSL